jgi:hypothetical protein
MRFKDAVGTLFESFLGTMHFVIALKLTQAGGTERTLAQSFYWFDWWIAQGRATVIPGSAAAPTFSLSPTTGRAGTTVSFSGSNFEGTTCTLSSTPSGLFTSSACSISSGTLTGSLTVASGASLGGYTVTVTTNVGETVAASFIVSAPTQSQSVVALDLFISLLTSTYLLDFLVALLATFLGVWAAFELDRRRQKEQERLDSIALLRTLKDNIVNNIGLVQGIAQLEIRTAPPIGPVSYVNVDPSFWRNMRIEQFYKLGLEELAKAASTFYFVLDGFNRKANEFLALQNQALLSSENKGAPFLTEGQGAMMWQLKSGIMLEAKYLQERFGPLPKMIDEAIMRLEGRLRQ